MIGWRGFQTNIWVRRKWHPGLYSLRRHRLICIGIPHYKGRIGFVMEMLLPVCWRLFVKRCLQSVPLSRILNDCDHKGPIQYNRWWCHVRRDSHKQALKPVQYTRSIGSPPISDFLIWQAVNTTVNKINILRVRYQHVPVWQLPGNIMQDSIDCVVLIQT